MTPKPPLGVAPLWLWEDAYPDPTLADLLQRYIDVNAAIVRTREAGRKPKREWLREVSGGQQR